MASFRHRLGTNVPGGDAIKQRLQSVTALRLRTPSPPALPLLEGKDVAVGAIVSLPYGPMAYKVP
jgi:hypothetical protein